jgi:hypothetical protein
VEETADPVGPVLVVSVDEVALRAGLPRPVPEDQAALLTAAIVDAQEDLEGYLGRALTPRVYTDSGVWPEPSGGWRLVHSPVIEVLEVTAEAWPSGTPTGMYTVKYRAGLDAAGDPELGPVRRFVRAHAVYSPEVRRLVRQVAADSGRVPRSVSVDGQSVSYEDAVPMPAAGSGVAGELPTKASCDAWRVRGRRVYQRPGVNLPWPYDQPFPLTQIGDPASPWW